MKVVNFRSCLHKLLADDGRLLFLYVAIILGCVIYWPSHNLLSFMIQGDIGRDLYVFERTLEGDIPYQDYCYFYGPLMPYYYALFLKLFGIQISSVILGKIVLNLLSGVLIYLSLVLFIEPVIALLAAVWFWTFFPDFQHTFNHTGGVTVFVLLGYFLLRYLQKPHRQWIYLLTVGLLAVFLIKINMGFAIFAAVVFSFLAISFWQNKTYALSKQIIQSVLILSSSAVIAGIIYVLLLKDLPIYYIKECLLIFPGFNKFKTGPFMDVFKILWFKFVFNFNRSAFDINSLSNFPSFLACRMITAFSVFSVIHFIGLFLLGKFKKDLNQRNFLIILIFFMFLVCAAHEHIIAPLVGLPTQSYCLYWAGPFLILLIFFIGGIGMKSLGQLSRVFWILLLSIFVISGIVGKYSFKENIKQYPQQFMQGKKAGVYIQNPDEWTDTVVKTTEYLKTHLKENDLFFALPYEPMYYYLTDKISPTRELLFFDHMHMPPEQEESIIENLERKHVNYVLLSNRSASGEAGLGVFGVTYCPLLAEYVKTHFEVVESFGDWSQQPTAIWGHAVKIYKRIGEL